MAKKALYVSNGDPSMLLPHLRSIPQTDFDRADNRHEAESALERDDYSIVLMTDLALAPGILEPGEVWLGDLSQAYQNGMRVARKTKEKGLLLYVLTSANEDYRHELKRIGANGVFKKVIQYPEFLRTLKEFFSR